MNFEKMVKNMKSVDLFLAKVAAMAFGFFIITMWPAAMERVHATNTWYFFAIFVIAIVLIHKRTFK